MAGSAVRHGARRAHVGQSRQSLGHCRPGAENEGRLARRGRTCSCPSPSVANTSIHATKQRFHDGAPTHCPQTPAGRPPTRFSDHTSRFMFPFFPLAPTWPGSRPCPCREKEWTAPRHSKPGASRSRPRPASLAAGRAVAAAVVIVGQAHDVVLRRRRALLVDNAHNRLDQQAVARATRRAGETARERHTQTNRAGKLQPLRRRGAGLQSTTMRLPRGGRKNDDVLHRLVDLRVGQRRGLAKADKAWRGRGREKWALAPAQCAGASHTPWCASAHPARRTAPVLTRAAPRAHPDRTVRWARGDRKEKGKGGCGGGEDTVTEWPGRRHDLPPPPKSSPPHLVAKQKAGQRVAAGQLDLFVEVGLPFSHVLMGEWKKEQKVGDQNAARNRVGATKSRAGGNKPLGPWRGSACINSPQTSRGVSGQRR